MNKKHKESELNVPALQAGDRSEFAKLVELTSSQIYRLALRMLKNQQDAEDILQETYIKAYNALPKFKGKSSVSTWLYRIATNEALMCLRRKHPGQISVEAPSENDHETPPIEIVDWCCLPESELMSVESQEVLDESVDALSESLKLVFLLRDIEGMSTREAAEILDISEGAVKTRLSRARLQLRELLSAYYSKRFSLA